jgi:bacteriocin biosynthesis cyclodehydratase domain-containing protein
VRPLLKPALRRLWRDPSTLQLGIAGPHALVLTGLTVGDRALLGLLDGSRDVDAVLTDATDSEAGRASTQALLRTLERAGALDDAAVPAPTLGEDDRQRLEPDMLALSLRHRDPGAAAHVLDRRRRAVVGIHGTGRVGAQTAMLLAAAGVGTLSCLDETPLQHADLSPGGLPRVAAGSRGRMTAVRAGRFTGMTRASTRRLTPVTLALVTPASSEALPEIVSDVRHEPHLLACVRETVGLVGPLVVPGRTPCLRCMALGRGERDPHWPLLSAQLIGAPTTEPCDVTLASLVASLAAMQALAFIDDDDEPQAIGGVLEFDPAHASLRRRSVAAHPACGCRASQPDEMPAVAG